MPDSGQKMLCINIPLESVCVRERERERERGRERKQNVRETQREREKKKKVNNQRKSTYGLEPEGR